MTLTTKRVLAVIISLAIISGLVFVFGGQKLKAAISNFSPSTCYSAAATSTLEYITATASTTVVSCNVGPDGARTATVLLVVNASSTASIFQAYIEESMNNLDWYPVASNAFPGSASTTSQMDITTRAYTQFTFASTTIGGVANSSNGSRLGVNATNNRNHYVFDVPVRMRYVRVYTVVSGANAGVWTQILPRQDIN